VRLVEPRDGWEVYERAEARLAARAEAREARERRRARRVAVLSWAAATALLPLIGAAIVVFVVERAGGDLGDWSDAAAAAFLGAAFLVPAAAGAWLRRRDGWIVAGAVACGTLALQVSLVFGLGFAVLGFGPD
jgi:cytochrome bd-type quinol oxidase subunit 2